jgi:hypothetical protein
MRVKQRFQPLDLDVQLACNLLGRLAGCVPKTPGMHAPRQVGKALPIGAARTLPARHDGLASLYGGLCLLHLGAPCLGGLQRLQALPSLRKGLLRLPQTTEDGERIPLGQLMVQGK